MFRQFRRKCIEQILLLFCSFWKMTLILVFDAYKVKGSPGSIFPYHNIHVVYTKEAETADQFPPDAPLRFPESLFPEASRFP